jgi:hypothetical protein
MKFITFKKIIVLTLRFLAITGFYFAADPAEGFWMSINERTGNIGWHIYQEGDRLHGMILSIEDKNITTENMKDSYPGFPIAGSVIQMPVYPHRRIYSITNDS